MFQRICANSRSSSSNNNNRIRATSRAHTINTGISSDIYNKRERPQQQQQQQQQHPLTQFARRSYHYNPQRDKKTTATLGIKIDSAPVHKQRFGKFSRHIGNMKHIFRAFGLTATNGTGDDDCNDNNNDNYDNSPATFGRNNKMTLTREQLKWPQLIATNNLEIPVVNNNNVGDNNDDDSSCNQNSNSKSRGSCTTGIMNVNIEQLHVQQQQQQQQQQEQLVAPTSGDPRRNNPVPVSTSAHSRFPSPLHSIGVVSFNMLAPVYKRLTSKDVSGHRKRESSNPQLWRQRQQLTLDFFQSEILNDAAIVALQEYWLDENYTKQFEAQFQEHGYAYLSMQRTGAKLDAVALLVKNDVFEICGSNQISLCVHTFGDRVALLLWLRHKHTGKSFLVANTHLSFPHNVFDRMNQVNQMKTLTNEIETFVEINGIKDPITMIMGDFNVEGRSPVCDHLRDSGYHSCFEVSPPANVANAVNSACGNSNRAAAAAAAAGGGAIETTANVKTVSTTTTTTSISSSSCTASTMKVANSHVETKSDKSTSMELLQRPLAVRPTAHVSFDNAPSSSPSSTSSSAAAIDTTTINTSPTCPTTLSTSTTGSSSSQKDDPVADEYDDSNSSIIATAAGTAAAGTSTCASSMRFPDTPAPASKGNEKSIPQLQSLSEGEEIPGFPGEEERGFPDSPDTAMAARKAAAPIPPSVAYVSHLTHREEELGVDHIFIKPSDSMIEELVFQQRSTTSSAVTASSNIAPPSMVYVSDCQVLPVSVACAEWYKQFQVSDHRPVKATLILEHHTTAAAHHERPEHPEQQPEQRKEETHSTS